LGSLGCSSVRDGAGGEATGISVSGNRAYAAGFCESAGTQPVWLRVFCRARLAGPLFCTGLRARATAGQPVFCLPAARTVQVVSATGGNLQGVDVFRAPAGATAVL